MASLLILKNNKVCGSLNMNELKNWKLELELYYLASHLLAQSLFVKWDKCQLSTGCPKKHGNSVTNWISSLLWICIVIPNFKSHIIITSARVYFMKRVKDCKDVSIMSIMNSEDGQVYSVYILHFSCFTKYNRMQSKINKQNANIAGETLTDYSFLRYHIY